MALQSPPPAASSRWWKPLLFFAAAVVLTAAAWHFRHDLTLAAVAQNQHRLRHFHAEHPLLLPAIVFAVYVASAAVYVPLGIVLSLLSGWLFGLWAGIALVSFATAVGATLALLISRYLLRDAISRRFDQRLAQVDHALERDGAFYLLSLRLVHVVPFWLINLLFGWTTIRVTTFWWATQLGTLPATLLYVYTGTQFPNLDEMASSSLWDILTWKRLAALLLLAVVPLVLIPLAHRLRRGKTPTI